MVNLELYRVFYTVAKCGSLTKAAEELYISQPAVSQAIKQLEDQIGGKLFVRTHKGVELSETGGKQIFSLVEEALNLFDQAESKYTELKDGEKGLLRICAADTVSTYFLLPFVKKFNDLFPDVKLALIDGTSAETVEKLKNNKGDIGFVNLPIDDEGVNLCNTVMQLHDTFVASGAYSDLAKGTVDLKRLQDYPLLMLDQTTSTRQAIVSYAHSQGVHLHPEIELSDLGLMVAMAKSGMGIACIAREFVKHELYEEKSLIEIKTNPLLPSRAIGLVVPKNTRLGTPAKEFIKIMEESING